MAPENRFALASVTTKLLTPLLAIVKPLSQPSAPPRISANAQAIEMGRPATCIRYPPIMTTQTPIEPTDRFMPPVASTTI